ncbi:MAG: hypothetical protein OCC46_10960 [Pseudodesulfovibrio sp.]
MLMWIHPAIQSVAMLLAFWVFYMGVTRFMFVHCGVKKFFNWKWHVKLGKIVHGLWLFGFALGLFMAWYEWGSIDLTGGHFLVGVLMVPCILLSLGTGLLLEKPKTKRPKLALFHGVVNTFLFFMACYQAWTAVEVIELFLLD